MAQPVRNTTISAREHAADCLAWRIDLPTGSSFLTGSTLANAIDGASGALGVDLAHAENVATLPGLGVTARFDGNFLAVGTTALFAAMDIRISPRVLTTIAQIRQRGNDVILVGGWKGVNHVAEIINPNAVDRTPVRAA